MAMTINPGVRLGPYEIVSSIGAGGMGEVYKARDTRLDRTVAVKVLPSHLSDNAERKERFEREAQAVSSLNHAHICTLHDIGSVDGIDFMVMEFIEGETLADRLKKGALPLKKVLEYGIQISDALDKAHRQGVVHRDLKPGNVMLTKPGVKLLDFGLAKLQTAGVEVGFDSSLPTQQKDLTGKGAILGTIQYMAPEQLEGKEADSRSDIFAFGAVLYEMLTGRKAFVGKSQASIIGAILKDDVPAPSETQTLTPRSVDHLVSKCLAKDPDDRWQTARDLATELSWIQKGTSESPVLEPTPRPARAFRRFAWIAVLLAALGLSVFALWNRAPDVPSGDQAKGISPRTGIASPSGRLTLM